MKKQNRFIALLKNFGDWAEKNKFWSDTIRIVVLGIIGTILVATIIESIKNKVAYNAEKDKAKLALRTTIIKDFSETSYHFTSLAVRYREGTSTFTELRNIYDKYRAIQHQMELLITADGINDQMQEVANKMLDILNKKTLLTNTNDDFEKIRLEIKKLSDTIEISALNNL